MEVAGDLVLMVLATLGLTLKLGIIAMKRVLED